jgi:hypothetical protein
MDQKILDTFRKQFALDEEALPDSMSTEDFSKFIENQAGKLFVKPQDLKNLQRKLSEKDLMIKELSEKKSDDKNPDPKPDSKISELENQIKTLTESITKMTNSSRVEKLTEMYPDISPEILANTSDENLEKVVESQRKISKKIYKDSKVFTLPQYKSISDVDKAIEKVKADKNLSAMEKASESLKLQRLKTSFDSE